MDKFVKFSGIAAPMPLINIDTDMLIPKQFLKKQLKELVSEKTIL